MATSLHRSLIGQAAFGAIAVLGTLASFTATTSPVYAASASSYYQAQLATPLAGPRTEVQSGVAWKCVGADCGAARATSRPQVVCARLARKLGPIESFAVNGEALDPSALARCNGDKDSPLARR